MSDDVISNERHQDRFFQVPLSWWRGSSAKGSFVSYNIHDYDIETKLLFRDNYNLPQCKLFSLSQILEDFNNDINRGWLKHIHFIYVDDFDEDDKFQSVKLMSSVEMENDIDGFKPSLKFHYASSEKAVRDIISCAHFARVKDTFINEQDFAEFITIGQMFGFSPDGRKIMKESYEVAVIERQDTQEKLVGKSAFCATTGLSKEYYKYYKSDFVKYIVNK